MPFINSGYGANQLLSQLLGINTQRGTGPGTNGVALSRDINSANGQLVGDTYLPQGTDVRPTGKKGYYRVFYNGQELGSLEPGGSNGRFRGNGTKIPDSAYEQINNPGGSVSVPGTEVTDTMSVDGQPTSQGGQPGNGFLTQLFGPQQFREGVDPGYQFRLQQGSQGILNGAAARTGALSGSALKSLIDYNQAAGSQEYGAAFDRFQTQQGNIYQRLLGITNLGQNAAAGVGQQGVATGATIGGNIIGGANASAAGQIGAANAINSGIGDATGYGILALLQRGK